MHVAEVVKLLVCLCKQVQMKHIASSAALTTAPLPSSFDPPPLTQDAP